MPLQGARHFLQIPGPTNVPDRVLRAIDHRGPEFAALARECLAGLKTAIAGPSPETANALLISSQAVNASRTESFY